MDKATQIRVATQINAMPFFCIHLSSATERLQIIRQFESDVGHKITVWPASEGPLMSTKYEGRRRHPREVQGLTTDGELGCLDSHISILERIVGMKYPVACILEDDVVMTDGQRKSIEDLLSSSFHYDILFLGANEWVEAKPSSVIEQLVRVRRFWGTHAFLITLAGAEATLATHRANLEKGFAYPADWLYAQSIQENRLVAYGPTNPHAFVRQKPGLVSAINGKIRS